MVKYIKISAISAALIVGITGCSFTNNSSEVLMKKDQEIQKLSAQLESKDKEIKTLQTLNEEAKLQTQKTDENSVSNSLVPPNAKPGECYAKVLVPAKYENKSISRLVKEAQTKIEVIPATYKVVEKKVTIREASTKLVPVPATYKTVTEKIMVEPEKTSLITVPATYKEATETIMVEPEKTELVTVPATYKTVSEKVLISPAHAVWKKGRGEIEKVDNATGDIMCLVEIPAVYKTVTKKVIDKDAYTKEIKTPAIYKTVRKRVLATPATTKEIKTPAVYKTVTKQVLVTPATTKEIKIPAICKMVKTRVIDTPAKEVKVTIPEVYETYNTKVKTSEPYLRWQEILCETNTTTDVVAKLQQALKDKKYNITHVDGIYGSETKAAVIAYQKDKGLNQGALTLKTLESLGL